MFSPNGGSVLLVFHSRLKRWLQPGGHVEPEDADLRAAALREAAEETGLGELESLPAVPTIFDVDVHPIPARREQPAHAHFDVRFLFRARREQSAMVVAGSDAGSVRWVERAELSSLNGSGLMLRVACKLENS